MNKAEEKSQHEKENVLDDEEEKEFSFIMDPSQIFHVPFQKYKQDFIFIVNNKKYFASRIIADILSPIISNFHFQDVIISEYSINTNIKGDFQIILDLFNFEKRKYLQKDIEFISEIFFHLGNYNYFKVNSKYCCSITSDNVIQRILDKLSFHSPRANFRIDKQNPNINNNSNTEIRHYLDEEIVFISSHFYEIPEKELEKLDPSILELILANPQLIISNEDSLFSLLLSFYLKDNSYGMLFEYVEFQNLNTNSIAQFIKHFDLCDLNLSIWSSICKRLNEKVTKMNDSVDTKRYIDKYSIPYNNQNFEGIIHLKRKENENASINEFIEVQSSSCEADGYNPVTTIEPFTQDTSYFATSNGENEWISYHFKKEKVKLTHYQLRTCYFGPNEDHLKNWVIEISNDGQSWEEVDKQTDCSLLNAPYNYATFPIKKTVDYCQYIRIRNTGPNWCDNKYLVLKTLEFYGFVRNSL
ncbi:hypothetical protein TRFO_14420 [Tritrichomonas foetus]|uniref:F5/8 type C domain-containing protein n=1 Tax=Tritrichomonas foetus TaxID=1144522 RepID=A0A1J4KZE0_9EUKA|nr:hypothetical protein TRFO_14420 [Tritrichomonas foetus]|eukprot:OHT15078.1 hypothetical protein TRFO_14420 [Tritrichomonas foetus]